MIILWIEVLIAICLVVVEIVMLQRMKNRNENWWRTYWARESVLLTKINEIERKTSEILIKEVNNG